MLGCECFERLLIPVSETERQCIGFLIQPMRRSRLAVSKRVDDALSLRNRAQRLFRVGDARGPKTERLAERYRNVYYSGAVESDVVGVTLEWQM